jgi:DNA-binding Xre family transcriptional regulator
MLTINLKPIFAARGIDRPFSYMVKAGLSRIAAHRLLNGTALSFQLRHVDTLCTILCCTPNDIVAWQPNSGQPPLAESHPLQRLRPQPMPEGLENLFKQMPLDELQQLIAEVKEKAASKKKQ